MSAPKTSSSPISATGADCDNVFRLRHSRVRVRLGKRKVEKPRTPTQSNQQVVDGEIGEQGYRITGGPEPPRMPVAVSREIHATGRIPVKGRGGKSLQMEYAAASLGSESGGGSVG